MRVAELFEKLEWHDSSAPDAKGKFRELGVDALADWLIKTRGKSLQKITGSLNQQIAFNKKKDPAYARKMESVRAAVKRKLGRTDEQLLAEEAKQSFAHWPEHIRLYGPYVAVRNEEYPHYVKYEVEELMGEPVNVQLSAGIIRGHNDAYEGGASYTAGKNGHFTQGLGIKVPADEAFDVNEFKKWAIDAMKTGASKLGLTEELEDDSSEADFQFKMILKAFQSSGFILDSSADDLSAGFVKGKWIYEFYCQSEADDTWFLGIGPEDGAGTYKKMWNGLSSTKVITTAKDWAAKHPPKVAEAVDNFPIRQRIRYWDKEVYLKGGYTMSMNDHQPGKTMFGITRLMENSVCGIANIFQRRQAGFVYWWSMHDRTGKQIAVQGVSDGEAFDQALFKKWVTEQLAKLPDDTAK